MFQNFLYAYTLRDTTVYTKLIGSDFTFTYWDYDNNVPVAWGREDEMRSTYNMFQLVNTITLNWNAYADSSVDSTHATVTRGFTLEVAFNPADIEDVNGKAYFVLDRTSPAAPWQITMWKDESNF